MPNFLGTVDAAKLPGSHHRPAAADGVRRAVDRSPDAEEQRRGARQIGEGVRRSDDDHDGRDRRLLRSHLPGAAGRIPGPQDRRAHVDEFLGRPERARCARRRQAARSSWSSRALDRGVQLDVRARRHERGRLRDLHGRRRLGRHVGRGAQIRHGPHGAGRRRARDLAAGAAASGSATGRARTPTTPPSAIVQEHSGATAWASTTPIPSCTRRPSASSTAGGSAPSPPDRACDAPRARARQRGNQVGRAARTVRRNPTRSSVT